MSDDTATDDEGQSTPDLDPDDIIEVDGREWVTAADAAKVANCKPVTVHRRSEKGDILCRDHPNHGTWNIYALDDLRKISVRPSMYELDESSVVEMYESGQNLSELSESFGVSRRTIARRLKKAGVKIRSNEGGVVAGGKQIAIDLNKTQRRVLLYTRWALGEPQKEFARRFGVSDVTVSAVESGGSHIGDGWEVEGWGQFKRLSRRNNIDPMSPKRLLHPSIIPDYIYKAKRCFGGGWGGVSQKLGINRRTLLSWISQKHKPSLRNHKTLREALQAHDLWHPPDIDEQTEGPEVELSDSDKRQICALADNTAISDIAMMYGVEIAEVRRVLREGQ